MEKPLIVANWKATKTIEETNNWVQGIKNNLENITFAQIVICAPYICLSTLANLFKDTNLKIGSQDVSRFEKGAYTGEITAEMLGGLVQYCLVGHSERRKNFGETDKDVNSKIQNLAKFQIKPIVCISEESQVESLKEVGEFVDTVVYEPIFAIGTNRPDTPENASKMAQIIKNFLANSVKVIYGGSVDQTNIGNFISESEIDGVLPGRSSWKAENFLTMIENLRTSMVD